MHSRFLFSRLRGEVVVGIMVQITSLSALTSNSPTNNRITTNQSELLCIFFDVHATFCTPSEIDFAVSQIHNDFKILEWVIDYRPEQLTCMNTFAWRWRWRLKTTIKRKRTFALLIVWRKLKILHVWTQCAHVYIFQMLMMWSVQRW